MWTVLCLLVRLCLRWPRWWLHPSLGFRWPSVQATAFVRLNAKKTCNSPSTVLSRCVCFAWNKYTNWLRCDTVVWNHFATSGCILSVWIHQNGVYRGTLSTHHDRLQYLSLQVISLSKYVSLSWLTATSTAQTCCCKTTSLTKTLRRGDCWLGHWRFSGLDSTCFPRNGSTTGSLSV